MKITRSELKKLILETMNEAPDGASIGTSTINIADARAKLVLDAASEAHLALDVNARTAAAEKLMALAEPFRMAAHAVDGTPELRDGDAFASIAEFVASDDVTNIIAVDDTFATSIQNLKDVSFEAYNDLISVDDAGPEEGSAEALKTADF